MGEGVGNEDWLMPYISSANISCGFHAGDESAIHKTIELCLEYNVAIGAHPSFDDRSNFGRREMNLAPEEIYRLVRTQIQIMMKAAHDAGGKVKHIKPHGALYNMAARDASMASSIVSAIRDIDNTLILFGSSGSHLISEAEKTGLRVANEVFADRTYQDNGHLTPRSQTNALITDVEEVVHQTLQFIRKGAVTSTSGKIIPVTADTICIHGDGPHAVEFAKAIYNKLISEGIRLSSER